MKLSNSFYRASLFFAAVCLIQFYIPFVKGLSPFWGDLTYLQHPWRIFDSQELMAGRLPLWNPSVYFGMPHAAAMQDGLFYPVSIFFYFFPFPIALFFFHFFHYWLACFLAYLLLRFLGFSHSAGICAGLLFGLSGILISREPFLNHLSVLALMPAICLFALNPLMLSLTLSCAFFAGYPQFLIGAVASSALAFWITKTPKIKSVDFLKLALGCLASILISSVLILPATQLFFHSVRSLGITQAEAFQFHFSFPDLKLWISPLLDGFAHFNPAINWWTCVYFGFAGFIALCSGLLFSHHKKSFILFVWIFAVIFLTLAGSNPASSWLWQHTPFLGFIRYPGNLTYLILIPGILASAIGFGKMPILFKIPKWGLILTVALELSFYAWKAFPLVPFSFFSFKGPLIESLQENLGTDRYLLSPLALEKTSGKNIWNWKSRLYGLTNSPFQINSAGNFGQPLVPSGNYALMDFLYGSNGLRNLERIARWADIRYLLAASPIPPSPNFIARGKLLWNIYETTRAKDLSRAYFLKPEDGLQFPEDLSLPSRALRPIPLQTTTGRRPDQLLISGNGSAGWVFASLPRYPGWKIFLRTSLGTGKVQGRSALMAFQKIPVPKGWKSLCLIYDSGVEQLGILISIFSLAALAILAAMKATNIPMEPSAP